MPPTSSQLSTHHTLNLSYLMTTSNSLQGLWSNLDQSTSNLMVVLNTTWTKSLTTKRQVMETSSTLSNGLVTDPKTMFGFQVTNYKITEPSTTTWRPIPMFSHNSETTLIKDQQNAGLLHHISLFSSP
jgi:hypothetical protein